jgi:predicted transcriptional regulator
MLQVPDMEKLCSLFFELSNEDRLGIVLTLIDRPLKLTQLARELDLTVQECSRQLARLSEIGLVIKDADGFFNPLPFGRHIFRLFPGYQFLSKHVDYFNSHTLSYLPDKFMGRIGELNECQQVTEIMSAFTRIEKIMREAEELLWYMTGENLASPHSYTLAGEAMDRGVKFRCIEAVGYTPPKELINNIPEESIKSIANHRKNDMIHDRVLQSIDIAFYMNEREVALLAFPSEDGAFDYMGFASRDESFIDWCKDVHQYYWNLGKHRDEYYIA